MLTIQQYCKAKSLDEAPVEKLRKSFRWFYTYYQYTAAYGELSDKGPVHSP